MNFADADSTSGSTILAQDYFPSLEEINGQEEFVAVRISVDDFESRWHTATSVSARLSCCSPGEQHRLPRSKFRELAVITAEL